MAWIFYFLTLLCVLEINGSDQWDEDLHPCALGSLIENGVARTPEKQWRAKFCGMEIIFSASNEQCEIKKFLVHVGLHPTSRPCIQKTENSIMCHCTGAYCSTNLTSVSEILYQITKEDPLYQYAQCGLHGVQTAFGYEFEPALKQISSPLPKEATSTPLPSSSTTPSSKNNWLIFTLVVVLVLILSTLIIIITIRRKTIYAKLRKLQQFLKSFRH